MSQGPTPPGELRRQVVSVVITVVVFFGLFSLYARFCS